MATTKTSRQLLEQAREAPQQTQLASYGLLESSWVFYSSRPVYELSQEAPKETFASIQSLSRATSWSPKPRLTPEQFIAARPNTMVVTSSEFLDELKKRLPRDFEVIQTVDYLFQDKSLLLLTRKYD